MDKTATEQSAIDMDRIIKMRSTDLRARQVVDMCVAKALNEHGEPDGKFERYAADIATEAVSALLLYIYDNDGEIGRLAVERDHYKRIAENALLFQPLTIASVDTHPEGGDAKQAPFMGSAVGEAETPEHSSSHHPRDPDNG